MKKMSLILFVILMITLLAGLIINYFDQRQKIESLTKELASIQEEYIEGHQQQNSQIQDLLLKVQSLKENLKRFQKESLDRSLRLQEHMSQIQNQAGRRVVIQAPNPTQTPTITKAPSKPKNIKTLELKSDKEELYSFSDMKMSKIYKQARELYQAGRFSQAKTKFFELVTLDPPFWSARLYYCLASYHASPLVTAGDINIQRMLEQFPDSFVKIDEVYKLRARLNFENGLYIHAMEWGEKAMELDEKDVEFRCYLANYASIYKDYSKVIHFLESEALKNNNNPECSLQLGEAYAATGNKDKAVSLYQSIISNRKGSSQAKRAYENLIKIEGNS